jgi:hypothetical protein
MEKEICCLRNRHSGQQPFLGQLNNNFTDCWQVSFYLPQNARFSRPKTCPACPACTELVEVSGIEGFSRRRHLSAEALAKEDGDAALFSPEARFGVLIALVIVITCGIMLPYRNITGDSPLNKTKGAIWQRTFCITAITMNIEQVKQFIKEVRWGFLATTDGRISCSTSVPVRVSVRVNVVVPTQGLS